MIRRPPRSTQSRSSAASDVYKRQVLIIDEAQNLAADVLEQMRLLTNLETDQRKLLQIILLGQPELAAMLERPELRQLGQRIVAVSYTHLRAHETRHDLVCRVLL